MVVAVPRAYIQKDVDKTNAIYLPHSIDVVSNKIMASLVLIALSVLSNISIFRKVFSFFVQSVILDGIGSFYDVEQ